MSFLHIADKLIEEKLKKKRDKLLHATLSNCVCAGYNIIYSFPSLFFQVWPDLQKICLELYQPKTEMSIDERMVISKARFTFKQYVIVIPWPRGISLIYMP